MPGKQLLVDPLSVPHFVCVLVVTQILLQMFCGKVRGGVTMKHSCFNVKHIDKVMGGGTMLQDPLGE